MLNLANIQTSDTLESLDLGDPTIGESIWIYTDRFFYIGRFRGRSKDGEFWVLDRASMVIQMGVVTDAMVDGNKALHEVHPFATPFVAIRYSSVVGWHYYSHPLPEKAITKG
jgi:hypothetical protein